jgi:hypothetical protein
MHSEMSQATLYQYHRGNIEKPETFCNGDNNQEEYQNGTGTRYLSSED